ncbi:helix-turn-helix transcriptional regulator [Erythrobacter sp. NFXS35]|uniref:helix-turn-helix transcriptional regulator n=1 Tax=Erythrobacter sp. NFXS35 TaxID=2818436 RepID=UPI0032E051C7
MSITPVQKLGSGMASSTFHALLLEEIHQSALPSIARRHLIVPRAAHVSRITSEQTLQHCWRELGAEGVVRAGMRIEQHTYNPCVATLLKEVDLKRAIDVWIVLQEHYHESYRIWSLCKSDNHIVLKHASAKDTAVPPTANSMLVVGVIAGMAKTMGIDELNVRASTAEGEEIVLIEAGNIAQNISRIEPSSICDITITWDPNRNQDDHPAMSRIASNFLEVMGFDASDNVKIQRMSKAVLECHHDKVSIAYVASCCAMSVRSLQRILRDRGMRFTDFLRMVRLKKAVDLLLNTDRSLVQIALSCGYYDSAHFSREFKSSVGVSPSQLREIGLQIH